MTVAPIRPDIVAPGTGDLGYIQPGATEEAEPEVVVKFENPLLLMLAYLLFILGWMVGAVSIPLNWMRAALRVGWDSARRLGGI